MTKKKIKKEEIAEDYCFHCKDGGFLRICDYKDCLKSYHPACVGKDNSFLESEEKWDCDWHSCFICCKASKFYCYCCPQGLCGRCISAAQFAHVKDGKGFCANCLKFALLVEEEKDVDSDGGKVDFKQRDTLEFLFMEYWEIVKEKEGLTLQNLQLVDALLKENLNFDPVDLDIARNHDGNYMVDSDYDVISDEENAKHVHKRKIKQRDGNDFWQHSQNKKPKKEFVGWCSKPLMEFLTSIGKGTGTKLSQFDVTSIINEYVREKKLLHPEKKKKIICDAKLMSLLGRKSVRKNKIFDLLEYHFFENVESEGEDAELSLCETNRNLLSRCKKQEMGTPGRTPSNAGVTSRDEDHSCYASIVSKNIKCVYLKRSVVESVLADTDNFKYKIQGSFVRIKSDPNDYTQRNSHQIVQVTGLETLEGTDDAGLEIVFQVTSMPSYVCISMLSDDDFSEEECEDLQQKMRAGLLKRPLVAELQRKACVLHGDIMRNWIAREVSLLQKLIDRANEKGWRKELFEYMERKQLLQTPSERLKLLQEFPEIIADTDKPEITPQDVTLSNFAHGTPESDEARTSLYTMSAGIENGCDVTCISESSKKPKEIEFETLPSKSLTEIQYVRTRKNKNQTSIEDTQLTLEASVSGSPQTSAILKVQPEFIGQSSCSQQNTENQIKNEAVCSMNNPVVDTERLSSNEESSQVIEEVGYRSLPSSLCGGKTSVDGVAVMGIEALRVNVIELSDSEDEIAKSEIKNMAITDKSESKIVPRDAHASDGKDFHNMSCISERNQQPKECDFEELFSVCLTDTREEEHRNSQPTVESFDCWRPQMLLAHDVQSKFMTQSPSCSQPGMEEPNQQPKKSDFEALLRKEEHEDSQLTVESSVSWGPQMQLMFDVQTKCMTQFPFYSQPGAEEEMKNEALCSTKNASMGIEWRFKEVGCQSTSLSLRGRVSVDGSAVTGTETSKALLIELSDDEDEVVKTEIKKEVLPEDIKSYLWYCVGPRGDTQGPFSLSLLRRWNESSSFAANVRVWKVGQSEESAILLKEAVSHAFNFSDEDRRVLVTNCKGDGGSRKTGPITILNPAHVVPRRL